MCPRLTKQVLKREREREKEEYCFLACLFVCLAVCLVEWWIDLLPDALHLCYLSTYVCVRKKSSTSIRCSRTCAQAHYSIVRIIQEYWLHVWLLSCPFMGNFLWDITSKASSENWKTWVIYNNKSKRARYLIRFPFYSILISLCIRINV